MIHVKIQMEILCFKQLQLLVNMKLLHYSLLNIVIIYKYFTIQPG